MCESEVGPLSHAWVSTQSANLSFDMCSLMHDVMDQFNFHADVSQ